MGESKVLESGVSVIICCYNSGWIIARCIAALKRQRVPDWFHWEIVLVNNNCTDDTVLVAEKSMVGSSIDFRIIKESEPGLANARATGIFSAKYKYAIFCDDDNLLCPEYVKTVYEILEDNPRIGAVGGKGVAEFECEPDPRILSKLEGYAVGSQLNHRDWLFGAGMALRTAVVRDVYANQKRYLVGRKGGELLSGDDTELAYAVVLRGYKTQPTDDISYTHVLRANRLTWEYCQKMFLGFDKAEGPLMVMRLVLDGHRFGDFVCRYIKMYLRLVKYFLFYWRPASINIRRQCLASIKNIRYWGMPTLYSIYKEWIIVKSL